MSVERAMAGAGLTAKTGPTNGKEPDNWSIKFRPLWQLDEQQQADVRLKQAQADDIYLRRGVAQPADIAASRFGGDTYSVETHLTAPAEPELPKSEVPEAEKPDPEAPPAKEDAIAQVRQG